MTNVYVKEIFAKQQKGQEEARNECVRTYGERVLVEVRQPYYNETAKSLMCPAYWDTAACWPDAPAGTMVIQNCPSYIAGFISSNNATRQCTQDGIWFISKTLNSTWTNYTDCFTDKMATILVNITRSDVASILQKSVPVVKVISETGYVVSFSTLIVAFAIMLFIKKLHCARNILHMHLFASFILRAFIFIVIKSTWVDGLGLPSDLYYKNGSLYFDIDSETNNWTCKLMTSFWQYFITANYSWILMEGLYLHNLIFRALFADSSNSIKWYVVLGWGFPLILTFCWITARLLVEDTLCWRTVDNYRVFLIIAVPIMISILINLVMFMRISMVLYSKLRSPINEDSRRYQKWIKSTLVLVPLFGIHYALGLVLYYFIETDKIVELVWLICDQLFGSFQGFFVAILYCFLNGEVKAEIQPPIYCFLTCLATNKFSKHLFPYRKKFLRSVVGRSSVCTTMSCSSLYTNGVLHRNSKSRLDSLPKRGDKKDHICHNGTKTPQRESKRRRSHDPHRHSQPFLSGAYDAGKMAETTLFINVCRSEPAVNEETLGMVPRSDS